MSNRNQKDSKAENPKERTRSQEPGAGNEEVKAERRKVKGIKESPTADRPAPPELQTENRPPQTEEMEVHHHPDLHHSPKPWKEYLLEGLMIFLAVTMGFFAESLREHITDKERATEQAHSFYAELKSDSAAAALAIKNWDRKNNALFYLKKYFKADSSLTNCSKAFSLNFYYALRVNTPSKFEPKTVILEQLKNSGSLRYFKSKELQRLTGELSVAISNVRQRNEVDNFYLENYINQFIIKYNDPLWYDRVNPNDEQVFAALVDYEKSHSVVPFNLNNPTGFNRNESLNMLGDFQLILKATRAIMYKRYQVLNHILLMELRKEYELE